MIGGRLTIKISSAAYTLSPTGSAKLHVSGQGEGDQFNFKVSGRPGAIIRFTIFGGKVQDMFFAEDRGPEMTFLIHSLIHSERVRWFASRVPALSQLAVYFP